jgi:LDH2 family malate/lactate/ureidoglycolate dehydrogenase
MSEYYVDCGKLKNLTEGIFKKVGCDDKEAEVITDLLISADLRGVRSHGVIRIKQYTAKIKGGGARVNAGMEIIRETPVTAIIDAKGAPGAVASDKAVQVAREKAAVSGLSLVSVKNSNHFGMAGYWALKLAGEDMVGVCGSNTSPSMPMPGAKERSIGNNPFALAYSGNRYKDVCVDMACSVVAGGKVKDLASRGLPIPFGWFLDADGNPSNDPDKVGLLLPFGGHKGAGVAFMIETLGTFLSGGSLSNEMRPQGDPLTSENASQFFACIKIEAFRPVDEFKNDVDRCVDFYKGLKKVDGVDQIMHFGEIERESAKSILASGVRLPDTLLDEIAGIAMDLGIEEAETKFMYENAAD